MPRPANDGRHEACPNLPVITHTGSVPDHHTQLFGLPTGAGRTTLLRALSQPLHRRVLEMRVPHQHRAAQDRHGDGGFRGQRAADLHLPRAATGIRPHRLRGGILGAGPGGRGGAHAVLLPPAGWRHPGLIGRTVGH